MRSLVAAYPVVSVSRASAPSLPRAPALIERVVTLRDASQDDDTTIVRIEGDNLGLIECRANTPGYRAELLPERTAFGRAVIVGVRIRKIDPNVTEPCGLCFTAGPSTATLAA